MLHPAPYQAAYKLAKLIRSIDYKLGLLYAHSVIRGRGRQLSEGHGILRLVQWMRAAAQVLCDLACVYDVCVRSAEPQPAIPGALVKVKVAPADTPGAFAAAAQTLRDTKHFVKDYGGGTPRGDPAHPLLLLAAAPLLPEVAGIHLVRECISTCTTVILLKA